MNAGTNQKSAGRCLVLGGRGFVGSALADEARQRNYEVVAVGRKDYPKVVGDSFDVLINANGNSKKFLASNHPSDDFDLSVRSVARSLTDFAAARYVHISSIDVYSERGTPTGNGEAAPIDPTALSPYGFHKFLAEQIVRIQAPPWLVLRVGGCLGAGLWKNPVYDMLKGKPLWVHPDSSYQYINTRDVAAIAFDLLERGTEAETFNVVGDGMINVRDVASMIPGCRLKTESFNVPKERYEINVDKLKGVLSVPATRSTVEQFVKAVLSGEETIV